MRLASKLGGTCFALAAALLLIPSLAAAQTFTVQPLQGTLGPDRDAYGTSKVPPLRGAIETDDGRIRVIVQLAEPPLALYEGGVVGLRATRPAATGARKLDVRSGASLAYRGYLAERQQRFLGELSRVAPGASVLRRYDVVLNGVSIAVDRDALESIAAMPGVKRIYPDRMNYQSLDASLPLIDAAALWSQLGGRDHAGAGIKVAVVDGGIRPENPMFDGTGFSYPPGFPLADDYCGTVDPGFCNGKLIVARSFRTVALHPLEHDSPLAYNGHGTHVAGIAVGDFVAGVTTADGVPENISGVAPGAWLMVYKGLWWNGTTGSGSTTDLIAAVDAAVADGADVINNSWGAGTGVDPANDAFGPTFEAANAAGVLSVVAAGNSGPGAKTIGCPGCQPSVLTVGNTTTNRIHALGCSIVGGPSAACLEGTGPALGASLGPLPIIYAGDVGDPLGCTAFPAGSFTGAIALISRGACNFSVKVANAQAAGAVFVKMMNNAPGTPIVMGSLGATGISSCMVSLDAGQTMLSYMAAHPGSQAEVSYPASRQTNDAWQDFVNTTSSRGPDGDPNVLKPDIAAPGTTILSAYSPEQSGPFAFLSGTSMASPHVAGAAALMLAKHPTWTPEQLKTALTSTSQGSGLVKQDGVTPADPFDVGAGRLDLGAASKTGVTFDLPSMADGACFMKCSFTRTIHSETSLPATWIATVENDDPDVAVKVKPALVILPHGGSASFKVTVDTTLAEQGQWHFARVVWKRLLGSSTDAALPIAVFATPATNAALLSKSVDQAVASPHDVLTYGIDLTNLTLTDPIDLVDAIPANSTYVAGSASALVNGVPDPSFAFDAAHNRLTWSGTLAAASLGLTASPSPFGYVPLSLFVPPLPCSSTCDDTSISLTGLPAFQYLGASYSAVVMSTNGFAVVGTDTDNAFSPFNVALPDPATPNNVLAPFWTDLDLDGTSATDPGAGTWYAAILSAGTQTFTVLEWQGAELFGVPGFPFTFQIWIEAGTSNIWFVYAGIPGLPGALTTGVEDAAGVIGSSYYFNGTGTAPAVGTDLAVAASPGGTAHFSFQTEVGCRLDPVVNVATITSGATSASAFAATAVEANGLALCVSGSCPGLVHLTGVGATPFHLVRFWRGDGPGSSTVPAGQCSGTPLDLHHPVLFPLAGLANGDGEFGSLGLALAGQCGDLLQAVDLASCSVSNTAPIP